MHIQTDGDNTKRVVTPFGTTRLKTRLNSHPEESGELQHQHVWRHKVLQGRVLSDHRQPPIWVFRSQVETPSQGPSWYCWSSLSPTRQCDLFPPQRHFHPPVNIRKQSKRPHQCWIQYSTNKVQFTSFPFLPWWPCRQSDTHFLTQHPEIELRSSSNALPTTPARVRAA